MSAPPPDDARKPQSPHRLSPASWRLVTRRTIREFVTDQCVDTAASLTFYAVLSLFPALLALVSLLGVLGQGRAASTALLDIVQDVAPGSTAQLLRAPIENAVSSPLSGFALVFGVVLAIWSASGYIGAFSRAMNRIYEIDEGRPFWKLKPQQLLVTIAMVVLVAVVALILVVSGPVTQAIGDVLGVGSVPRIVWGVAKWPLLLAVVVLAVALLYATTPNARQPRFRWISVGATIAIVVLAIATALFGFYVSTFGHYEKTYGPLAGAIVFLLWLWIANLALLFGAEFDAETERVRELQAGIAAEDEIQLPPRDVRLSEKSQKKEAALVAEARRMREEAAQDAGSGGDEAGEVTHGRR